MVQTAVALDSGDPAAAIRSAAPDGVHRIVEVALSANADLDAAVVANDAVIAADATAANRTEIPFWPLIFANVTIHLLGSDDFPASSEATGRWRSDVSCRGGRAVHRPGTAVLAHRRRRGSPGGGKRQPGGAGAVAHPVLTHRAVRG